MARFIDADRAMAIICDRCKHLYLDEFCPEKRDFGKCGWRKYLEEDAADVVPVVHGRWDDSGRYTFPNGNTAVRCTICGCSLAESEYKLYDWNYCPICGARMDAISE